MFIYYRYNSILVKQITLQYYTAQSDKLFLFQFGKYT